MRAWVTSDAFLVIWQAKKATGTPTTGETEDAIRPGRVGRGRIQVELQERLG